MNISACLLVLLRLSNTASAYNFQVTEGGEVSGKKTYTVTKVTDDEGDESTFRGAIKAAIKDRRENGKPAVIRFGIPCTGPFIELSRELKIDGAQDLTIDGSDQPGGVTIANFQVASNLSKNLVLRHLRFRPGRKTIDDENSDKNKCKPDKKCSTGNDALYIQTCEDCLVEHCSFGLATDEALSVEASRKVIVRKNIMGPGITAGGTTHFERNNCTDPCTEEPEELCGCNPRTKSYHNFGSLWNANDDLVAHDNIWSGFNDRCPQLVTRSACCDDDGKPSKKLEDPDEDCPDGYTYCLGQNSKPSLYLYNNVIARCKKGTSFKAYRGDINVWKNVYLNDNSGELDKSLYWNKGDCSRFQSRKHIFEDKYGDVDDKTSKKAFENQAYCDAECEDPCGDDPDEDGFGDSSPQSALEEAIEDEAWGAHPLDEFDQLIIDSIKNDDDLPRYTGYYPNIRKGKKPQGGAKVAIQDNTDNGCKA